MSRAAWLLLVLPALASSVGPNEWSQSQPPASGTAASAAGVATEAEARVACSTCHLFPTPDILPRYAWRDENEHIIPVEEVRKNARERRRIRMEHLHTVSQST